MQYTATGSLYLKRDTQVVSDKFSKREFVLLTKDQYPQYLQFQLTNDKTGQLDNCNQGEELTVHFNLRGREWQSPSGEVKYFNTLEAWKIERGQSAPPVHSTTLADVPAGNPVEGDLPF